ncbi:MAG TPA: Lrp/AsnC family transcriptional regulator [Pseudonocardiaceae bacterium]|nr:Lrp/AsnC family transcriptional regulator [Pseudonocardiaceae bacterium]
MSEPAREAPVRPLGPLEAVDRAILRELVRDGRCTLTELAERVGLSVSAVHQRVRRLEQRGAVRGYTARLDLDQLNLPLTALISLTPIDPAAPDDYPTRLRHLTQIESCYSVAGNESYVLLVRVASPLALEELLRQIRESANVSTRTTVVLSTPFESRSPGI